MANITNIAIGTLAVVILLISSYAIFGEYFKVYDINIEESALNNSGILSEVEKIENTTTKIQEKVSNIPQTSGWSDITSSVSIAGDIAKLLGNVLSFIYSFINTAIASISVVFHIPNEVATLITIIVIIILTMLLVKFVIGRMP